ncbi:MAG TPA: glutamine amidotransferase family protein, partial [Candidatus Baltobacteraceae bacterium]
MCGIVGLFLKDQRLNAQLGELLSPMLASMSERGPDSAGFAVYSDGADERAKITVQSPDGAATFHVVARDLGRALEKEVSASVRGNHAVLSVPGKQVDDAVAWLHANAPELRITAVGRRIEIYKDTGEPAHVSDRLELSSLRGTHAIGHTRMATESAVTTSGAHPFSTGFDQCLVHNGSLSNHNSLRRTLVHDGFAFETENDSEVAAAYLTWRMRQGMDLGGALESALDDLDGFYTFVVGTESGFGVLRDPIACKPAVMAETDDYVAFGSEYRALAVLPDIEKARLFEPE